MKNATHLTLTAASLVLASVTAQAQTAAAPAATTTAAALAAETEFYGLLDTTVRFSTNQSATGKAKAEMADGVLTGSRLGLRGKHPVGSLKAIYTAEAGFAPDTGTSQQGGRVFGRQLFVGLEGEAGTLLAGRQYTLAHDVMSRYEAFAYANNSIVGYQGGNYTGLRHDNTLRYAKALGDVTVHLAHTFGEVAGSAATGSTEALAATYAKGDLTAGLVYQHKKNVIADYFGLATTTPASTQKVLGGGATYQLGASKLYFGYTGNQLDVSDYKNRVYSVGVNHQATTDLQLIATLQADKLKHAGVDGDRLTSALMADYYLDKVTDVYVEVDYTQVKGGWIALANNSALGSGNLFGKNNRKGVMVGARLKF